MSSTLYIADHVRNLDGVRGDAVHVVDGVIAAVGSWRELNISGAEVLTMPGTTIYPGFRDAHLHPGGLAASATGLDVGEARTFSDLRDLVREYAGRLPPHVSVVATGFDDERVTEGRMPTRSDLDRILSARPILVYRHCSHIASANSPALARAGVDTATIDPPGGQLERTASGQPTGILRETAIGLVAGVLEDDIPGPTPSQVARTLRELTTVGITSIDAIVSAGRPIWCDSGKELETLLAAADQIPQEVKVFVMAATPNELRRAATAISEVEALQFGGWKGFADGSLGGHTALLRSPYSDRNAELGLDRWEPAVMPAMAETALELGGQVAIHAIGDAALEKVVALAEAVEAPARSFRAEHASIADPSLIDRMAGAGVVASVQPQFIISDGPWIESRLGPQRAQWAYPLRSMHEAGVEMLGGSDAPIETPDPLTAVRAASSETSHWHNEALETDIAMQLISSHDIDVGQRATLTFVEGNPADDGRVVGTVIGEDRFDQERRWGATSAS